MLTAEDIRELAKMRGLKPHQEEKRYVQCAILSALCNEIGSALAFKGGTALFLLRGLDRFSEDLDFTATGEIEAEKVIAAVKKGLSFHGIAVEVRDRHSRMGIAINANARGPLYTNPLSVCSVKIEISGRGDLENPLEKIDFAPKYGDIGDFGIAVMDLEEVMAEKIRAVMTRNAARDAYDLAFLLGNGVKTQKGLVDRKLSLYGKKFSFQEFEEALHRKESMWESELRALVMHKLRKFSEVEKEILEGLKYLAEEV